MHMAHSNRPIQLRAESTTAGSTALARPSQLKARRCDTAATRTSCDNNGDRPPRCPAYTTQAFRPDRIHFLVTPNGVRLHGPDDVDLLPLESAFGDLTLLDWHRVRGMLRFNGMSGLIPWETFPQKASRYLSPHRQQERATISLAAGQTLHIDGTYTLAAMRVGLLNPPSASTQLDFLRRVSSLTNRQAGISCAKRTNSSKLPKAASLCGQGAPLKHTALSPALTIVVRTSAVPLNAHAADCLERLIPGRWLDTVKQDIERILDLPAA